MSIHDKIDSWLDKRFGGVMWFCILAVCYGAKARSQFSFTIIFIGLMILITMFMRRIEVLEKKVSTLESKAESTSPGTFRH